MVQPFDLPFSPDRLYTTVESLHVDQFLWLVCSRVPGTSSSQVLIEARPNVSSVPCVVAAVFAENYVDVVRHRLSDSRPLLIHRAATGILKRCASSGPGLWRIDRPIEVQEVKCKKSKEKRGDEQGGV